MKFVVGGTETEQGVVQLGPIDVTAKAPGGNDSSWMVTGGGGAGLNMSRPTEPKDPQPDSAMLEATTTNRRRITPPAPNGRAIAA